MLDRVLTFKQAAESTGLSEATFRRLIDRGDGPSVTQLSPRRLGFRESHLVQWLDGCVRQEGDEEAVVPAALTDLREHGLVPWDDIVDETREVSNYTGSATVAEDWLLYLDSACLDPWGGQVPFILTESRSLAGVLRAQCRDYRCRMASTNGQVGGFLHTKVAPLLKKGDRVGYLGDYDLAGGDIEANTRRVLESIVGELDWRRLALTEEQVVEHSLPRIIKTDKRFKNGGGEHEAVETEALSQTLIVSIVRDWLDGLLPQPIETVLVCEQGERERLRQLIEEGLTRRR